MMRLPFIAAALGRLDQALRELACARLGAPHFGSWSTGVYACDLCRRVLNDPEGPLTSEGPPTEEASWSAR
jgi:hypothetical protein